MRWVAVSNVRGGAIEVAAVRTKSGSKTHLVVRGFSTTVCGQRVSHEARFGDITCASCRAFAPGFLGADE